MPRDVHGSNTIEKIGLSSRPGNMRLIYLSERGARESSHVLNYSDLNIRIVPRHSARMRMITKQLPLPCPKQPMVLIIIIYDFDKIPRLWRWNRLKAITNYSLLVVSFPHQPLSIPDIWLPHKILGGLYVRRKMKNNQFNCFLIFTSRQEHACLLSMKEIRFPIP